MNQPLEQLRDDMISTAKKGYPILMAGSIVFLVLTFMPFFFPMETVHLIWIWGLTAIFPFGLLLGKLLKVNLLAPRNPLANLGTLVAFTQIFFLPVFIIVYMHIPEYLPLTIGLLGGSHFLPYIWIYKSKAYLTVTLGICLSSFAIGGYFIEYAFTLVPLAISFSFAAGGFQILKELRSNLVGKSVKG